MYPNRKFAETHPYDFLILSRFPLHNRVPSLSRGSYFPVTEGEVRAQAEGAKQYRKELESLSYEELRRRVEDELTRQAEAAIREAEEKERTAWYNLPSAHADFNHWAKMSYWTVDEAVALSLNRDPNKITWKEMNSITEVSPFAHNFQKKREVANRAKAMGQLWERTIPRVFLAWASRMRFDVPSELIAAVEALGFQIADWKTLYDQQVAEAKASQDSLIAKIESRFVEVFAEKDRLLAERGARIRELEALAAVKPEKPVRARERDSLLKLIIGMAIKGYGHDPKAARSPTAKEISGDLALQGISLDEDTVRKYLAEAQQLLPGDETEENR